MSTVSYCWSFSFHIRAGLHPGTSKCDRRQATLTTIHADVTPDVCIWSFNIPEKTLVPKCSVFSVLSILPPFFLLDEIPPLSQCMPRCLYLSSDRQGWQVLCCLWESSTWKCSWFFLETNFSNTLLFQEP